MKSFLALSALLLSSAFASAAETQLVIFVQYEDAPLAREVSTAATPLQTNLLNIETKVCFRGNAADVPVIIQAMIDHDLADGYAHFTLLPTYILSNDETSVGEPEIVENLQLFWRESRSRAHTLTYPVIRPCNRKSK